jgi:TPR repeat protein
MKILVLINLLLFSLTSNQVYASDVTNNPNSLEKKEVFLKSLRKSSLYLELNSDNREKLLDSVKKQYNLALQGDVENQIEMAVVCYLIEDFPSSIYWLEKASEQGNAKAQMLLGEALLDGRGTPKDFIRAFNLFNKAVEQKNPTAQYYLGIMYRDGKGVSQDSEKAFEWFKRSAENGNSDAQYQLAHFYFIGEDTPKNPQESFKWFEKAALQGCPNAQYELGVMYQNGEGVPANASKAFYWTEKSAQQGKPVAELVMGHFNYVGFETEKNDKLAFEWYKKSADHGDPQAHYILDNLFTNGVCTNKDLEQTLREYNMAESKVHTQGEIIDNRYYDPTKTFSVAAVSWPNRQNYFEEGHVEDAHYVSFRNDLDGLVRVEVIENIIDNQAKNSEDLAQEAVLRDFFQYHLESIEQLFPGTKIIEKNEKNIDCIGHSLFAIIWIPKGSKLGNANTGEALDTVLGYIFSFSENQLVAVSIEEESLSATKTNRTELNVEMYKRLIEIRKSYKRIQ